MRYRYCEIRDASSIRLYWRTPDGKPIGFVRRLDSLLRTRGQRRLAVMNAGMSGSEMQPDGSYADVPIGLHIENGAEWRRLDLRPPASAFDSSRNFYTLPNGVFFVAGGHARVMESNSYFQLGVRPTVATQSGPLLVQEGRFTRPSTYTDSSPARLPRNAVGVRSDGVVLFVMAESATNMYRFRAVLRDTLLLQDALYLDGLMPRLLFAGEVHRGPTREMVGILAVVRAGQR